MIASFEFNARPLKPADVARTFVPPASQFEKLVTLDHHILLGPRGSGKTTLLKMLTAPALANWRHPRAPDFTKAVRFNAAFVQTDRVWSEQALRAGDREPLGAIAFSVHTLISLLVAMQQAAKLGESQPSNPVGHLSVSLSRDTEAEIARALASTLRVDVGVPSLFGVESSLRNLLAGLREPNALDAICDRYRTEALADLVSALISTFNTLTGDAERRWAFLFDELEIAPAVVLETLVSSLRGRDNRVVLKLALSPFHKDLKYIRTVQSPQFGHDFKIINLTYPRKSEAREFSTDLTKQIFERFGIDVGPVAELFETSGPQEAGRRRQPGGYVPAAFSSLASKDSSFREYAERTGLFDKIYSDEGERGAAIRKILPVVLFRDFYLAADKPKATEKDVPATRRRSRKSFEFYAGAPWIIEITEGNPRAILTLMVPLAQKLAVMKEANVKAKVTVASQSEEIEQTAYVLESLIRTIPAEFSNAVAKRSRGLLGFLDIIGRYFQARLFAPTFEPEYHASFIVDSTATDADETTVGNALNAGALVFMPDREGYADELLVSLKGKRFRFSYLMCPRYLLPLVVGEPVSLGTILRGKAVQSSLFDEASDENP